jgi:predicted DNA-binding transcriptional regulator AlpA
MIIYSLNDAAKFFGCSLKTVQRMVERSEMPKPVREEKDRGGKMWRFWDSSQLEELKRKVQERQKYFNKSGKLPSKIDIKSQDKGEKSLEKHSS